MSVASVGRAGRDHALVAAGVAGIGLVVGVVVWSATRFSYDTWGGLVIAPLVFTISLPLLNRVVRVEDPRIVRLMAWGLVFKLAASFARFLMAFVLYDTADAIGYVGAGTKLSALFRQGIFTLEPGVSVIGTYFMKIVTGVVFTFIGPTKLGGFVVFSWLAFWGLYLFYRAFRIGVPNGDHRRYALLVFFLPSLLFWPSSIGKDAWMILMLGLSAYGVAHILTRNVRGYPLLCLGLLGVTMVRPHMSALVCCGMTLSSLVRRSPEQRTRFGPLPRVIGIVVLVAVSVVVITQAERFFGVEGQEGAQGVNAVLATTQKNSTQGGSEYEVTPVRSPVQLPWATVTILFRPFPFEAHNVQSLIASIEGLALMGVAALSWPRFVMLPSQLRRNPYLTFAAVYSLLFVVAFSNIGNFGILTRQRAQLFPFALVFFALPVTKVRTGSWRAKN
jgi:hypothetical protein